MWLSQRHGSNQAFSKHDLLQSQGSAGCHSEKWDMFYWVLIKNDHFSCAGKRIFQKQVQVKENSFLLQIFRARIFYAHTLTVMSLHYRKSVKIGQVSVLHGKGYTVRKIPLTARVPKSVMHLCCFHFIWNDTTWKTTSKSAVGMKKSASLRTSSSAVIAPASFMDAFFHCLWTLYYFLI